VRPPACFCPPAHDINDGNARGITGPWPTKCCR
jgi:hypothetical protein